MYHSQALQPEEDPRQAITALIAALATESAALADLVETRRQLPAGDADSRQGTENLLGSAARLQMVMELLLAQAGQLLAQTEDGAE